MISIENVYMDYPVPKRYRELILKPFSKRRVVKVLHGITLNINEGDRVAFLGPNGVGKTTLLKLIGGLLLPTSGHIIVNGNDTIRRNMSARKSVGFVLNEERSFYWPLTGKQNLEFFGALDNLRGKQLHDYCDELLGLVGLEDAADLQVSRYSSGMKQRLALARGLISKPKVLILDEPTRALDLISCEEIIELIFKEIYGGFRTLLLASHRPEEVERLCNKVVIINHGRVVAFHDMEELKAKEISVKDLYFEIMRDKAE